MKNRIITNSIRAIRKSFPRFLSLMVMSFLGVFVFAGLQATSPDMINTLDNYLDTYNTYDIKLLSDKGFGKSNVDQIKDIDGVTYAEGAYYQDTIFKVNESEDVICVSGILKKQNNLEVLEGRMPVAKEEIVVEKKLLEDYNLTIGDTINLNNETFVEENVKIVGVVDSSLYFNDVSLTRDRGRTSIGSGTIKYYSFVLPENFDVNYYTYIYVSVDGAKKKTTDSEKYNKLVDEIKDKIKDMEEEGKKTRHDEIYEDYSGRIKTIEDKANEKLQEASKKLTDAKEELEKGKSELLKAREQLIEGKKQLDENEEKLKSAKSKLDELKKTLDTIAETLQYDYFKDVYQESLKEYNEGKAEFDKKKKEFDDGVKLYKENVEKYKAANEEYEKGMQEYKDNERKIKIKIDEYKKQLDDIELPMWYIYDRTDDSTYSDYIDDSRSIANLSKVFPVVFFAVAVLVSLISMNRMVEEDRLEIGTLKSSGFDNKAIATKYFMFSFLATAIGGILGSISGLIIIPKIIYSIYKILFELPDLKISLNLVYTLLGFVIVVLCVCGTSLITIKKELKEKPSELMRPKAPKMGKRIFLERLGVLWNKLKFSNKVTIRNLFRYKKRVLVTIGGIAGCTALMICGFGIKDSINDIARIQYKEIYKFDDIIYADNLTDEKLEKIRQDEDVKDAVQVERVISTTQGYNSEIIVVENNEEISKILNLKDNKTDEIDSLEKGKVIITSKLSELTGLGVGDKIDVIDIDNKSYTFEISNVVKNYIEHYIYIDKATYESFNQTFYPNLIYVNANENKNAQKKLSEKLLEHDFVLGVYEVDDLIKSVENTLKSLDKVVVILIVLAAMLAFVVLYNLSNININERKREIATLKVLGFYNKEVDNYITKENIILTLCGILIGIIIGSILTKIIVVTIEIERAKFINFIKFPSYIYASSLSIIFTLIVNVITHFNLKRINMIDSLKSVE